MAARQPARDRARRLAGRVAAAFPYLAALADALAIFAAAAASAALYEVATLGRMPEVEAATTVGLVVAAIVVMVAAERGQYGREGYATRGGQFTRALAAWNFAFLCALALLFATRTSSIYSRARLACSTLPAFSPCSACAACWWPWSSAPNAPIGSRRAASSSSASKTL